VIAIDVVRRGEGTLSRVSNRMNAVRKRLTALATIALPFTAASGCPGMNFAVMPWLKPPLGIAAATGLIVSLSVGADVTSRRMDRP
jgi:Mg2+ and Co2+ transporter CorA